MRAQHGDARRKPDPKYRVNAVGEAVVDNRTPGKASTSSPARAAYKAARYSRRHPAAAAMRSVAAASAPKVTGESVIADLTDEAAATLADFIIADAELRGQS